MGKILIYAMQEGLGGVEQYVVNLSKYFDSANERFGYIVLGNVTIYEKELKEKSVDIFYIPAKKYLLKNIMSLFKVLKKQRQEYDTLYFNTSGLYYPIPYLFAIINHYKIVIHSHLTEVNDIKKILHLFNRWWINKFTNKRFACSTPAAKWMFGENERNFRIIPNAINLEKFQYNKNDNFTIRNNYGFSEEDIIIGNVGRLSKIKNQSFLLDILYELYNYNQKYQLLMVGDGEEKERLFQKAEKLGIQSKVTFWGRTEYPEYPMNCMDVIVMPSLTEGFPITIVEAQAAGIPCVISDAITKEVNLTGNVDFLSLDNSAKYWAKHIEKISKNRYKGIEQLRSSGFDVKDLSNVVYSLINS